MPPIPLDTQELALLEHYQKRLQTLRDDRALRQTQLDRVSKERARVQREYGLVHNRRVAAISRLSEEMLSEVFKFVHRSQRLLVSSNDTRGDSEPRQATSLWRAEVVLSSVCSRWRTNALGLRSLWSLFWCDKPSSCARLVHELARLRTYLQRSRTHSLELFFDFTCPEPYEPEPTSSITRFKELVQEMLGVAVGHAERWKQITILANDTRRRVPVTPLRADIWAPKLERMVVCTGTPSRMGETMDDEDWSPQVLLLGKGDLRGPCPALRYLKLDRAGLQSCRPCIARLTHLVLEYGSLGSDHDESEFVIEWPALLDILRSPRLESLSLCEKLLCRDTFPDSPWVPKYHLHFPKLKHLRLGSSFRRDGWSGLPSQLLWFLLRYIVASQLETLEISSFIVGESPWTEHATGSWPILEDPERTYELESIHAFPSLRALTLSDIRVFTEDEDETGPLGFLLLERMTRNAQTLILSDHQSSLIPILSQTYPFNRDRGFPEVLWPHASDLSINFDITGHDAGYCLDSYASWCLKIRSLWKNARVVRLPAVWADMRYARLLADQGKEGGSSVDRREDNDGDSDDGEGAWTVTLATGDASIGRHPIRIIAFEEVFSSCWPPGPESTPFNTLKSEQFEPFNVEFGRVSAVGTGHG